VPDLIVYTKGKASIEGTTERNNDSNSDRISLFVSGMGLCLSEKEWDDGGGWTPELEDKPSPGIAPASQLDESESLDLSNSEDELIMFGRPRHSGSFGSIMSGVDSLFGDR
jgi:hypothetical protein